MNRRLSLFRRIVCVPLGLLWLGVLAMVAVPVILYMTVLYFAVQGARRLLPGRRPLPDLERDGA